LTPLEAVLLGAVQGATEFLPISSSGHLVLVKEILGVKTPGAGFEVFAHLGTLVAILVHYRTPVLSFLRGREGIRSFALIGIGVVPAVAVGLAIADRREELFGSPRLAAAMLIVTGVLLLTTRWCRSGDREVGLLAAVLIGVAQAVAILPGISRSGATIATGLYLGVRRSRAAEFSFLIVIPVLLGAAAWEAREIAFENVFVWTIGAVTAMVTGFLCLRWLLIALSGGRLHWFAWYCFAAGGLGLFLV
jgi:undecaprenyl-diphosphatase